MSALTLLLALSASAPATAQAPTPKIVVVVIGDPDDALREAARRVEDVVARMPEAELPTDAALRAAFRGDEAPAADDGLERARSERRRLGWSDDDDLALLRAIGRMAGAAAVATVRRDDDRVQLALYSVRGRAFFERTLVLAEVDDARLSRFLARRLSPPPAAPGPTEVASEAATTPAQVDRVADEPAADPPPSWLRRNWAYLVAGVLLAGAVTVWLATRGDDDPAPPVLRFTPGGSR